MCYVGKKFNKLTILKEVDKVGNKKYVLCKCECGREKVIRQQSVVNGLTKSCGKGECVGRINDISGNRYGKILVLEYLKVVNGRALFKCICDCGKECEIQGHMLIQGLTTTCTKCNINTYYTENDYMVGVTNNDGRFYFDVADFSNISGKNWFLENNYVVTKTGTNSKRVKLHRYLLNCPDDMVVDHIDGNPLNNRRNNIRICTQQQNIFNSRKNLMSNNKYKGVTSVKDNRYRARITKDGKCYHLGTFRSEEEAARAYNEKAIELYGEYAKLNNI